MAASAYVYASCRRNTPSLVLNMTHGDAWCKWIETYFCFNWNLIMKRLLTNGDMCYFHPAGPSDSSGQRLAENSYSHERGEWSIFTYVTLAPHSIDFVLVNFNTFFQIEVKLSMKFTSREFSLKRMPSRKPMGVFGVKISTVTKWADIYCICT